ncbi:MAG: hypothetical protein K6G79_04910 [Bacteroidales bacterium]|nr:hypothetical protein [Bacteroidales bacterium]
MHNCSENPLSFNIVHSFSDFAFLPIENEIFAVSLQEKTKDMRTYYNLPEERLNEIKKGAARFNEAWTQEEKEKVCAQFQNGMRINEIAETAHRTVKAIRIKLMEAGEIIRYPSRQGLPWTEEESERLGRFHSQGYSVAGSAKLLGRLRTETEVKLIELGLLPPREKVVRNPAYPNAFLPWSDEESAKLQQELSSYREALTALARIAKGHGRSLGSIVSRAEKTGLCSIE